MSATPLVLVGGGGHASDVLQAVETINSVRATFHVVGILADDDVDERRFVGRGVRHLGSVDEIAGIDAAYVLCVGWSWTRRAVAERIADRGSAAPPIIHPNADVGVGVELGAGTVVLGNVHLSPMVRLGAHGLVSYNATVGHDSAFGAFASVMPGANVSGDVVAGDGVLVGTGAVIREGIRIGDGARVGAGAVVVRDVLPDVTVAGVPARPRIETMHDETM